jgi:hypothetical protein
MHGLMQGESEAMRSGNLTSLAWELKRGTARTYSH